MNREWCTNKHEGDALTFYLSLAFFRGRGIGLADLPTCFTDLINLLLQEGGKRGSVLRIKSFLFLFLASSFHSTILQLRILISDIKKGAYKNTQKIQFLRALAKGIKKVLNGFGWISGFAEPTLPSSRAQCAQNYQLSGR